MIRSLEIFNLALSARYLSSLFIELLFEEKLSSLKKYNYFLKRKVKNFEVFFIWSYLKLLSILSFSL